MLLPYGIKEAHTLMYTNMAPASMVGHLLSLLGLCNNKLGELKDAWFSFQQIMP